MEHDLRKVTGKLAQGDVKIGKAVAKLTGTYDMQGETTSVNMNLDGEAMPVDDLEADASGSGRDSAYGFAA